jgi:SPP1 family predicted phage head-tail adaptor
MDSILKLVSEEKRQNDYGVWEKVATVREVFCKVDSVTRAEFFEGGRNGLNPQFRFTVFRGDYNGETVCQYDGLQYAIYRTYMAPDSDYMELYCERKGGTNV